MVENDWLKISVIRRSKGIYVWAKADPRIEEFLSSLGKGTNTLEEHGSSWQPTKPGVVLSVYRFDKNLKALTYTLATPTGHLVMDHVNLSFLRFVGISGEGGIEFMIPGPSPEESVRSGAKRILIEARNFVKDYVADVSIVLKISGQEF